MNPVAKLAAAAVLAVCLVLTIDPVSAGVALVLELALFPLLGIPWATFWRRTLPVWIAAPLTALTIALYGRTSGTVYVEFLFVRISDGSLEFALATLLRVLAIALPAVVLFATIDPTDLADGLAQVLHLPPRFVLGALAGVRLMGLAMDDWRSVALARRARGVADRGVIRRFFGQAFTLLVLSLRRASTLATAMEARGFGAVGPRTWARESRWGAREWLLVLVGAAIGGIALTAAILTGNWRPLIG
ncbi:energy-coupling factor transporter transmembrane component T [Leifsonia sp. H3M29-4]|uniref:energy-coupling factor transporter transmembrane component T family protein n=1 Tax=Salinibacterium metalliresistens TaxID=3031321 RepID=UPI0023DCE418|nr:energy-coupling factor transporter transmembrane component T [Salinibacterium metalliresistens]MDF1478572.1 energy-coupling factor transporter transmembrane component T [Salinibacterium metalliresistens]